MLMLTGSEIQSYLARLGIPEVQPPSLSYLRELHKAHVEKIPWQTVDIVAGRPAPIDPASSVRLLTTGRSGYCFHLNGAFQALLRSLGYRVSCHRAGVQPLGQEPRINSFHLGLTVTLPDEEEPRWIVDAGLGDMPFEPLPLRSGEYPQGPLRYRVTDSGVAVGGWRLEHDPSASFTGVDVAPEEEKDLSVFVPKHEFYSTSPESPWINLFLVRHRHAEGSNEVRGCIWIRHDSTGVAKTELRTREQWLEVLGDVFGEHLVQYSPLEREELWKRVHGIHEEWKRTRDRTG
ncbi:arylamine N-acetyltransferase family protein [Paenibacillus caseinilyticus]|uniref:N-acetyltransferase n=1 Tax=Paenibacillus mucilaginosus K02 TaxID=997761 RepID=I0BJR4_9BACL|nr:arylamine N-acetyltransferase [Paenibacillus mucilaginosus]AFH62611.1 N-acetyltransferase [Paenibacillus mucilaginosus K02]